MLVIPHLEQIKRMRKKAGISQTKLASMVDISQSHLAKIELGKVDPSYSLVARIFDALDRCDRDECWQYMTSNVMTVRKGDKVEEVVNRMREGGFSQAPVMESGKPMGLLTERRIIEMKKPYETLLVEDAIEDPVIVPKETPYSTVATLINQFQAVLVLSEGRMEGILTATDLIGHRAKEKKRISM